MVSLLVFSSVMRLIQVKCQCNTGRKDFHSNVTFGLMAKAYHALVGTFASHDEVLSLKYIKILQKCNNKNLLIFLAPNFSPFSYQFDVW